MRDRMEEIISFEPEKTEEERISTPSSTKKTEAIQTEEEIISFEPEKTEEERISTPSSTKKIEAIQTEEEIISFEPEKTEEERISTPSSKKKEELKEKLQYLNSSKSLFYTFAGLIITLLFYDVISSFYEIYQFSTLLAFIFLTIIGGFLISLFFFFENQLSIIKSLKIFTLIQSQCNSNNKNYRKNLKLIVEHFPKHPKYTLNLKRIQNENIANEKLLQYISDDFMTSLDNKVEEEINSAIKMTFIGTTLSRIPTLDMLIVLWKSVILAKKIIFIYGYKPSALAGILLTKKALGAILFAGGSESVNDIISTQFDSYTFKLFTSSAQGLLNAQLIMKLGYQIQNEVRPIPFDTKLRTNIIQRTVQILKDLWKSKRTKEQSE